MNLYPLIIQGSLAACKGDSMSIPFELNRASYQKEVQRIYLYIKDLNGNIIAGGVQHNQIDWNQFIVTFAIGDLDLKIGQHYKVQLYYQNAANITSPKSTVGVIKYAGTPNLTIPDLKQDKINNFNGSVEGLYTNSDAQEKVYQYSFSLYDNHRLLETSGWLLHNSRTDNTSTSSFDRYTFKTTLNPEKIYNISYSVITINGIQETSKAYYVMSSALILPELDAVLEANSKIQTNEYYDEGIIEVSLKRNSNVMLNGKYILARSCSKDNFSSWFVLKNFSISGMAPNGVIYQDKTAEHGYSYVYGIAQTSKVNNYTSGYLTSNIVISDFEDIFLTDKNRQLKVKFNPKISTFKNTLLESKMDTIGGTYPTFFRNGNVKYKEFNLSGLISYHSDEKNLFFTKKKDDKHSQLTTDNIVMEKEFRLEALEWLNNGQPKLFRSATEGTYIIRLLNVSLTPMDTLGRMVYTFNATAYECAEYTEENLINYNIIEITPDLYYEGAGDDSYGLIFKNIINSRIVDSPILSIPIEERTDNFISVVNYTKHLIDLPDNIRCLPSSSKWNVKLIHSITIQATELENDKIEYVWVKEAPNGDKILIDVSSGELLQVGNPDIYYIASDENGAPVYYQYKDNQFQQVESPYTYYLNNSTKPESLQRVNETKTFFNLQDIKLGKKLKAIYTAQLIETIYDVENGNEIEDKIKSLLESYIQDNASDLNDCQTALKEWYSTYLSNIYHRLNVYKEV